MSFYQPKSFRTQHESNRQASNPEDLIDPVIVWDGETCSEAIRYHHIKSLKLFNKLIELGVCREQARGVLPQNLYTEYYGTVNLSNLLKFIELRTHEGAQWEIQKVAEACLQIATDIWPTTVGSYHEIRESL